MNFPNYESLIHEPSPHFPVYSTHLPEEYSSFYSCPDTYDYCQQFYGLRGKLFKSEVLTLLELAYFADGPVLELGCFHGASTITLCKANSDVTTIDISHEAIEIAEQNFIRHAVKPRVIETDAVTGIKQLIDEGKKFNFVFVDHDHAYETMYNTCVLLPQILKNESYLFFHDFQDRRNKEKIYGVYQAVKNTLANHLQFVGLSGSGAIFLYKYAS